MLQAAVGSQFEAAALLSGSSMDMRTANNIRKTYDNFLSNASFIPSSFKETISNSINTITNFNAVRNLDRLKLKISNVFKEDVIRPLKTVTEIQTCQSEMKRYIMAHPVLREKFNKGHCYGYGSEGYVYHKDEYDYKRVVNHMVMIKDDKAIIKHFYSTIRHYQDNELTLQEKSSILSSWEIINRHLKTKSLEDPTSPWGGLF